MSSAQDLPTLSQPKVALSAARNGYTFYKHLQDADGHWPGEYGGPMFLLPGLVIGSYVTGMPFKPEERKEMVRYLLNRANPTDGGWGMSVSVLAVRNASDILTLQTRRRTLHCLRNGLELLRDAHPRRGC